MIKGIGPMLAERMVAHFGAGILAIIEEEPGRLTEVRGLGPKRTRRIAAAWEEQKAIKEVMVFLSGVGVSTSLAVRIYKKYAGASISVVRDEPYRLASQVWGIGFKTADTIARAVGIPHDSPERIKAGLQHPGRGASAPGRRYRPAPLGRRRRGAAGPARRQRRRHRRGRHRPVPGRSDPHRSHRLGRPGGLRLRRTR